MPRKKPEVPAPRGRPKYMCADLEESLLAQLRRGRDLAEAARASGIDLESVLLYAARDGVNRAFSQKVARATREGTIFAQAAAEHGMSTAKDHLELAKAEKKAAHYTRKLKALQSGEQDDGSDKLEAQPVDMLEAARGIALTLRLADRAAGKVAEPTAPLLPAEPAVEKQPEPEPEPAPAEPPRQEDMHHHLSRMAEASAQSVGTRSPVRRVSDYSHHHQPLSAPRRPWRGR